MNTKIDDLKIKIGLIICQTKMKYENSKNSYKIKMKSPFRKFREEIKVVSKSKVPNRQIEDKLTLVLTS